MINEKLKVFFCITVIVYGMYPNGYKKLEIEKIKDLKIGIGIEKKAMKQGWR